MYVHVYVYERPIGGEKSERGREREDRNEWRYNKQKFVFWGWNISYCHFSYIYLGKYLWIQEVILNKD